MSRNKRRAERCAACRLHLPLCACTELPRLDLGVALVIVRHHRERNKTTNTGGLLHRMLAGSHLLTIGARSTAFDAGPLTEPGRRFHLLYPQQDAPIVSREQLESGDGFALLDGTWRQCSRMARRGPVLADLPCIALPPGPPSIWRMRTQHDKRGLSTVEAGIRLLALLVGNDAVEPLRHGFRTIAARTEFMRGRRPTPVIPLEWDGLP